MKHINWCLTKESSSKTEARCLAVLVKMVVALPLMGVVVKYVVESIFQEQMRVLQFSRTVMDQCHEQREVAW